MRWNKSGVAVELANVPGSGTSRVDPNARSGNPRHDTRSGKFGAGGGGGNQRPLPNQNVDRLAYARMFDAARDAARSLDDLSIGTIEDFVKGRANAPDQVDIQQFLQQVVEQRKADLIDLLDQELRSGEKRQVRMTANRGQIKTMIGQMAENDIQEVMARLEGMGHDPEEIDRFLGSGREKVEEARKKKDSGVAASDWAYGPAAPVTVIIHTDTPDPEALAKQIKFSLHEGA